MGGKEISLDGIAQALFGDLHFYVFQGSHRFAEVMIEEGRITIEILSVPVTMMAVLSHVMRKSRFGSHKLQDLKGSGYRVFIKWGRLVREV